MLFIPNDITKFLYIINYKKERGFVFKDDNEYEDNLDDEHCKNCCEVIGNIHENKEILDFMEKEEKAIKELRISYDDYGYPSKEYYAESEKLSIQLQKELEDLLQKGSKNEIK